MNISKLWIGWIIWLWLIFLGNTAFAVTNEDPESLKNGWMIETTPRIMRKKTVAVSTTPPKLIRNTASLKRFGVHEFKEAGIVVIKPRKRDHVFDQSGTNVREVAGNYAAKFVVNGAYFRRDGSGSYNPAGALWSGGQSSFDSTWCKDVNLCSRFDLDTLKIDKEIQTQVVAGNMRSAGPWIVREWQINPDISKNRSHWQRKTTRTALVSSGTVPYFVVSTTWYTLPDFSLQLQALFPSANALNLDWWSSTSFYSPKLSFNSKKLLPEFFIMR